MPQERQLHLYLHSPLRENAASGKVNLFRRLQAALPGWTLYYHPDTEAERARAAGRGHGLFLMHPPTGPHILCLRKAYLVPFWRIEAVAERWLFDVARATFDPEEIPPDEARAFLDRWRFKMTGPGLPSRKGYVLVPLQGRLSEHRSFQSMSPLAMLETVLERVRSKPVVYTLHPKEDYPAADLEALARLEARFPRLKRGTGTTENLLLGCDAVITQNSSVALNGYFAQKAVVLFAAIDFHHIAGSVLRDGLDAAFAALDAPLPDHARYLCWFFRRHAINGGAPDCEAQIQSRLLRHGWTL